MSVSCRRHGEAFAFRREATRAAERRRATLTHPLDDGAAWLFAAGVGERLKRSTSALTFDPSPDPPLRADHEHVVRLRKRVI